jgi:hypothetical protein
MFPGIRAGWSNVTAASTESSRKLRKFFCYYFFYKQRQEDRILAALVRKSKTIIKELGSFSPVVEERLDSLLERGISRQAIDKLERDIDAADLDPEQKTAIAEELEDSRERQLDLQRELDSLRNLLDQSRRSIGLEEGQFRSPISSALQLLGAEPLAPSATESGPQQFTFPAVDRRAGGDSSWVGTMDARRAPKPRDQNRFDWRRESPIRPVVFEDPGRVTDEVVQLHLEHPVVQRLLARFTAQGPVLHDLSRACLAQTHDSIPRVALIGRLALYGPGAARLHEDLIWVTARWIEPQIRKGPLSSSGWYEVPAGSEFIGTKMEYQLVAVEALGETASPQLSNWTRSLSQLPFSSLQR